MIETATIITLVMLYLVFFRPGTTPLSTAPLVIERTGKYRMTLAPQLNLAQPFIENVAKRIEAAQLVVVGDCVFEVCDKRVTPKGIDCYELVIVQKDGMLNFEARNPQGKENGGAVLDQTLNDIVRTAAAELGIKINPREETSTK